MKVLIDDRQNNHKLSPEMIRKKAQAILNALDCPDGELSILIVNDSQIEALNKQYFNRYCPTNVIAFPMGEGKFANISPQLLGDVVISVETAYQEGINAEISMEERFMQLLIHGILHLFGYDHETTEQEALKMEKKSEEIMKVLSFKF